MTHEGQRAGQRVREGMHKRCGCIRIEGMNTSRDSEHDVMRRGKSDKYMSHGREKRHDVSGVTR